MEQMPLIIVASVGGLLILLVILFIRSQKKQDRKDAENTQMMLDNLKIDLKDATEDAEEEFGYADEREISAERPVDVAPSQKPAPEGAHIEPTGRADEEIPDPGDAMMIEPGDDEFKMTDNQNELVIELEDEREKVVAVEPGQKSGPDKKRAEPKVQKQGGEGIDEIATERETEMSELDALFEASSDVEDMVLSAQKSSMFGVEMLPDDSTEGDLLEIDFSELDSSAVAPSAVPAAGSAAIPIVTPEPPPIKDTGLREPPPLDPEDQIRHEKAKRIARVIVNDIRNYNPDNLAEGIRIGNIMKTLGKEVERGRLLYIKRVPPEIAKETNYYRDALVKILADGQPELLGF